MPPPNPNPPPPPGQSLVDLAMVQVSLLQSIAGGITALKSQRNEQFSEENKRRLDLYQVNNRLIQQLSQIGQSLARNQGAGAAAGGLNMASDLLGMVERAAQRRSASMLARSESTKNNMLKTDYANSANRYAGLATVASVAGKLAGTFSTLIMATKSLVDSFIERAKEISHFSPQITIAESKADVKRMMADVREAKALGPDYGKLIDKQVEAEIAIRDAIIPIKKAIIEAIIPTLEEIAKVFSSKEAKEAAEITSKILPALWDVTLSIMPGGKALSYLSKILGNTDAIKKNTDKDDGFALISDLLKEIPNIDPMPALGPAVVPGGGNLNLPVLGL